MLYPEIEPNKTGMLVVDDIHTMYWEECGNPKGFPVVFIHGGPGAGASPSSRRFFDPDFYRIIVFDQRGSGRSTPLGEVRQNTTPLLIEDMEKLRNHLNIDRWMLFGGSWGSTLAIAYAEHHPDRCLAMVLRGIFLCRPAEIDWFIYGMSFIFPENWMEFADHIPEDEQEDLMGAYKKRLMDPDPEVHMPAAIAWSRYEGACATLLPSPATVTSFEDPTVALGLARMEAHYFTNDIFLPDNYLLDNIDKVRDIPAVIIQGRYDVVCPISTAHEVAVNWPEAEYIVVTDAGHSAFDPSLCIELVKACDGFRDYFKELAE